MPNTTHKNAHDCNDTAPARATRAHAAPWACAALLGLAVLGLSGAASAGKAPPKVTPCHLFDGVCANKAYVSGLVESEGQTYRDHSPCRDELDARIQGCLDVDIVNANGVTWTYRLEDDACVDLKFAPKPCYAGFEWTAKIKHTTAFFLSENGYDLIDTMLYFIADKSTFSRVMETDVVTHVDGWSISSGVSTEISAVTSDGLGQILGSETSSYSVIADSAGTPSIAEKCSSARERLENTGYTAVDLMSGLCDQFSPDNFSVDGWVDNKPVWCDMFDLYYERKSAEASSIFYDECLSHASNFFPSLYTPGEIGDDPIFEPLDPVFIDEESAVACAEATFTTNYTAYIEIAGVTWSCEGVATATCGSLNTGVCGCVYAFNSTPTCTSVVVEA